MKGALVSQSTKVTEHLVQCVKALRDVSLPALSRSRVRSGYEAVLELLEQPWEDIPEDLIEWRRGYEQCLLDVCNAVADEWGIPLPASPIPE